MGCCSSTQGGAESEVAKRSPLDRATQLPAGLSFHLPTTGPLSPQEFRQRLVCSAGTQEVHIPTSDYTLKFAYVSFRGYYPEALYKPSQDTACTISNFAGDPEQVFLGVFDGHGTSGTECSQFAKEQVCEEIDELTAMCKAWHNTHAVLHFVGACSHAERPSVQVLS